MVGLVTARCGISILASSGKRIAPSFVDNAGRVGLHTTPPGSRVTLTKACDGNVIPGTLSVDSAMSERAGSLVAGRVNCVWLGAID